MYGQLTGIDPIVGNRLIHELFGELATPVIFDSCWRRTKTTQWWSNNCTVPNTETAWHWWVKTIDQYGPGAVEVFSPTLSPPPRCLIINRRRHHRMPCVVRTWGLESFR